MKTLKKPLNGVERGHLFPSPEQDFVSISSVIIPVGSGFSIYYRRFRCANHFQKHRDR